MPAEQPVEKHPFIPYVEERDYPEKLKPLLDPYVRRMEFLPNALKLYMHRPEIAETLWRLNSNIMRDRHRPTRVEQALQSEARSIARDDFGSFPPFHEHVYRQAASQEVYPK